MVATPYGFRVICLQCHALTRFQAIVMAGHSGGAFIGPTPATDVEQTFLAFCQVEDIFISIHRFTPKEREGKKPQTPPTPPDVNGKDALSIQESPKKGRERKPEVSGESSGFPSQPSLSQKQKPRKMLCGLGSWREQQQNE